MNDSSAPPAGGLSAIDFVAVIAYLAVTFGIAVWFGRKQQSSEDFFVGGRRMPWFAVGLSILATLFSTLSYLGVPGEMIKQGIGLFSGYLAVPFSFAVVTLLWIPFFMRLRLTSAYEYLEKRFDRRVRVLGATLFVLLRLGWMSMVVFAASLALDKVKGGDLAALPGADQLWWILAIGLVAAVYTAIGGIQAVIWVDVLQCVLLLAGVLLAIGFVAYHDGTGPFDWWRTLNENVKRHTHPPLFTWDVTVRVTIAWTMFGNFFWTICTHGSDQVVLQRYFSTASLAAARRSYLINVIVDLTMASLLSLAGLALLAFYLRHADLLPSGKAATDMADKLFPHFLGNQLPAGCAGLILSAFLCDAIQTLESGVNAITAVVTKDLLPRRAAETLTPAAELTAIRRLTVVISLFVTASAYGIFALQQHYELTLVDMMPKFFNMFVGPLAALFFIGMFLPRCTSGSALGAVTLGLTVSFIWSWWEIIFGTSWRPTIFLAVGVPCLTTIATAALLSLATVRDSRGREFSWRSVTRRS